MCRVLFQKKGEKEMSILNHLAAMFSNKIEKEREEEEDDDD